MPSSALMEQAERAGWDTDLHELKCMTFAFLFIIIIIIIWQESICLCADTGRERESKYGRERRASHPSPGLFGLWGKD